LLYTTEAILRAASRRNAIRIFFENIWQPKILYVKPLSILDMMEDFMTVISTRRWVSLFKAEILSLLKVLILALFPKGLLLLVYTATGALQVRDLPEWVH